MSSESGSPHGGGWLITYCDMVTLLMACFIMIITFASKEPDRYMPRRGSLVGGQGGSGPAGVPQKGPDHNATFPRPRPALARVAETGSEMPSVYADPSPHVAAVALQELDAAPAGTLADSYTMRVPAVMVFDVNGRLSPTGTHLLHTIAQNLRRIPYDIQILVDDPAFIPRGVTLTQHLARVEKLHPGRLGVGVKPSADMWNASIWFVYVRQR